MGEKGAPQILSLKIKTFDADCVKDELMEGKSSPDSGDRDSPDRGRFSGRLHRRSIRRGSKYKMSHRSPTELLKVKKVRRMKANDRERTRMQTLNHALEKLRVVLPAFPDETKLTKIETLRFANSYIQTLTEQIKALDTGLPPNLPVTGWEGMLAPSQDSLQHCAILAHSLMSQQFGPIGQGEGGGEGGPGTPWDQPLSPAVPVRGQQQFPSHPGQQYHAPHPGRYPGDAGQEPSQQSGQHFSPSKLPASPPGHYTLSPQRKVPTTPDWSDNNPGFYPRPVAGPQAAPAPHWAPELAIQPGQPSYDDLTHPPITSSLYGQDLRYNNQYY